MNFGIYLPNYGAACSAQTLADLAREAEDYGWDGFFIWDHILLSRSKAYPMVDPWVALAAMAMATQTIKLGTTVTPLPRRRPWKLARETTTLDHLSQGRLILSVGIGEPAEVEYAAFGEQPVEARTRGAMLDEGLDVLAGLWSGETFSYNGAYYQLQEMIFQPASYQKPRIPIWVGGFWPHKAPMRRAARWDGAFPLLSGGKAWSAGLVREVFEFIKAARDSEEPFDLVRLGTTANRTSEEAGDLVRPFAEAGITWWLENLYPARDDYQRMRKRLQAGPPKPG
jgi:alkanesulfonate monooxygenase SsuD/methylene tetrahydromethanopterin reductase-like flavin-dependent oxidoreductase (luciferase family)